MAKRIFEIARDLGTKSKVIIEKCRAEDIPADTVKNHMSSVSAGLEATIREWFSVSEAGDGSTAVETAAKVDVEKVRTENGGGIAVQSRPTRATAIRKIPSAGSDEPSSNDVTIDASPVETPAATPADPVTPVLQPAAIAPAVDAAGEPAETVELGATLASAPAPEADTTPQTDVDVVSEAAASTGTDSPAGASGADVGVEMNVPRRPEVIKPAGPQLADRAPVKLSGPKIVRVEAPETLDPPRPRRSSPSGGPGGGRPRGGGGAAPPMIPSEEDRGRSPRRNNNPKGRRSTPGTAPVPARRRGRADSGSNWSPQGHGAWSEQDLAEREARLARSGGYLKQRRQQMRHKSQGDRPATPATTGGPVKIEAPFTIKDLSSATGVKGAEIVKKLFMQNIPATINSGIEPEHAQEIMLEYNIELEVVASKSAEETVSESFDDRKMLDQRPRGPVVTILGHVDHGKTSLLDRIRNANVADGEAGGITQATSAFRVPVEVAGETREIVFLDTPGHEAFTAMRARGAHMTDLVVLVVAADDGVMPQTAESISHAKAAGVPIVVALNKTDKPEATDSNIQKILGQLAEHELNPVEWGGQTEVVRTSALKNEGITDLLEVLEYQAELLELTADFAGPARGTVIESRFQEGRGAVASVLVQDGNLKVGDFIVAGRAFGRVRDITDDHGDRLDVAGPPAPVQISGLGELPDAGDKFYIADSLKKAQAAAEGRRDREREAELSKPKVTLDALFTQMEESDVKEIQIVLKADVQGSVDVLKAEVEKIATTEVKIRVIHAAVGGITESDVLLADASSGVIIGFNVIPSGRARPLADQKNVEIRTYQVIYDITDDVRKAAEGLLEPELRQEILGHAEVRQVFKVSKVGAIAGCYITDGSVQRDALIRVTRDGIVIENDRRLEQLKRFKDDAKDVRSGMECGMKIAGYDDIKAGDVLECYKQIEVKRTL